MAARKSLYWTSMEGGREGGLRGRGSGPGGRHSSREKGENIKDVNRLKGKEITVPVENGQKLLQQ